MTKEDGRSPFMIRGRRVLGPDKSDPVPASLMISKGIISEVLPFDAKTGLPVVDAGDSVIMAGIVDTHAHINEPGRTDWEGFQTGTHAAAAGGITTVVDMPLNSIPATTTLDALRVKIETAQGKCQIDYGFWGGVVPGNSDELESMIEHGALGFKAFLCESGVDEFPMAREEDLREAMPILARAGVPLLVHAELEDYDDHHIHAGRETKYRGYLDSRPSSWEVAAIQMMIELAKKTGCRTHIVHLSTADGLKHIRDARAEGVPITAETCPHYLYFESEKISEGATQFKCAPPIREHENRERLWKGLKDGTLELVVSDHSPCTPNLKLMETGDFSKAWGGISGLQFSLPVVWTEMKKRGFGLVDLWRLMSANPARFAGLGTSKGRIAPGYDADLIFWNPESRFRVEPSMILHKNKVTPYEGCELEGRVERTYVRGACVYQNGQFPIKPAGKQQFKRASAK